MQNWFYVQTNYGRFFLSSHSLFFSSSEFINIHFNKHTKSAVCVCMWFTLSVLFTKKAQFFGTRIFMVRILNNNINCFYLILWCHYSSNWKRFCVFIFILSFFFSSLSFFVVFSFSHFSLTVCLLNYIWLKWKHKTSNQTGKENVNIKYKNTHNFVICGMIFFSIHC